MEWILPLVVAVLGFGLFVHQANRTQTIAATVLIVLLCGAVWWRMSAPPKAGTPDDPASAARPLESREGEYVSSDACRSCHPAEYASWRHSYHRSMTQVVTPETMLADWDGTELEKQGRVYRLEQEGDQQPTLARGMPAAGRRSGAARAPGIRGPQGHAGGRGQV